MSAENRGHQLEEGEVKIAAQFVAAVLDIACAVAPSPLSLTFLFVLVAPLIFPFFLPCSFLFVLLHLFSSGALPATYVKMLTGHEERHARALMEGGMFQAKPCFPDAFKPCVYTAQMKDIDIALPST